MKAGKNVLMTLEYAKISLTGNQKYLHKGKNNRMDYFIMKNFYL